MKLLSFADAKRTIITFEAEDVDLNRDGDDFILVANGKITFQDTGALEELMHSDYLCQFTVSEGGTELMHGRYHVTFMALEEDMLAARISVGA